MTALNNRSLNLTLRRRPAGLRNSLASRSEPAWLILRVSSRLTAITNGILTLGHGSIRTTGKTRDTRNKPQHAEYFRSCSASSDLSACHAFSLSFFISSLQMSHAPTIANRHTKQELFR